MQFMSRWTARLPTFRCEFFFLSEREKNSTLTSTCLSFFFSSFSLFFSPSFLSLLFLLFSLSYLDKDLPGVEAEDLVGLLRFFEFRERRREKRRAKEA